MLYHHREPQDYGFHSYPWFTYALLSFISLILILMQGALLYKKGRTMELDQEARHAVLNETICFCIQKFWITRISGWSFILTLK